uniref:Uncharacterized protein n=1 Tax=Alexandrium monilatum TaxID=311494 RepID=A0A7S4PWS0_9DINO
MLRTSSKHSARFLPRGSTSHGAMPRALDSGDRAGNPWTARACSMGAISQRRSRCARVRSAVRRLWGRSAEVEVCEGYMPEPRRPRPQRPRGSSMEAEVRHEWLNDDHARRVLMSCLRRPSMEEGNRWLAPPVPGSIEGTFTAALPQG